MMDNLPEEILEHILLYLSVTQELQYASKVCRKWRKLCAEIYTFKLQTFKEECKKGNLVWRDCSNKQQKRAQHFIPKHMRPLHTQLRANIQNPSPRVNHGTVAHNNLMFVFGGCFIDEVGPYHKRRSYFNDLHRYDILEQKWEKVKTTGMPPPRCLFSMTKYKDNIVICGGEVSSIEQTRSWVQKFDDIYIYNITNNKWYKAGKLNGPRSSHQATCLKEKLIVFGGTSNIRQMCELVEVCSFTEKEDGTLTCTCKVVPLEHRTLPRFHHLQVKLDDHRLLVYGGQSVPPSAEGLNTIRKCDGWILQFDESYSSLNLIKLQVNNLHCYKGVFQTYDNSGVRVGTCVVFVSRPIFILQDPGSTDVYTIDEHRKPSCDLVYKRDYYHTFVLDLERAVSCHTISWCPVPNNPPKYAPRNSVFHTVVCIGDSFYVFGGAVDNNKYTFGSNNLYKINVNRTISTP